MVAKEKSGFAVMQYVDEGKVLLSVDSMALDNAAAASGFVGTLAPHAAMISGTSDAAASVKSRKCRRVMYISRLRQTVASLLASARQARESKARLRQTVASLLASARQARESK